MKGKLTEVTIFHRKKQERWSNLSYYILQSKNCCTRIRWFGFKNLFTTLIIRQLESPEKRLFPALVLSSSFSLIKDTFSDI